mmetsp:Transcript_11265/g.20364  ORF Transcript_11265/g.20364 Transcript_11265/m.20364 type:complete len:110 (-) Transcript_11265:129-458(-)
MCVVGGVLICSAGCLEEKCGMNADRSSDNSPSMLSLNLKQREISSKLLFFPDCDLTLIARCFVCILHLTQCFPAAEFPSKSSQNQGTRCPLSHQYRLKRANFYPKEARK